jgi:hypothetical protein
MSLMGIALADIVKCTLILKATIGVGDNTWHKDVKKHGSFSLQFILSTE